MRRILVPTAGDDAGADPVLGLLPGQTQGAAEVGLTSSLRGASEAFSRRSCTAESGCCMTMASTAMPRTGISLSGRAALAPLNSAAASA
jgi:hypothetical protein